MSAANKLTAEQRGGLQALYFAVIDVRGTGDDRWDRPENRWAPRGTRTDRERLAARVLVHARSCRCYACDGVAVGTRDRRPEGGSLETACARHAEVAS